ncbi:hypothetical protein PVT71_22005 [Salipiger sp. H15]|uniref:Uncharacterized protein n=1 Tax=Alloyangia sp. H15 TaxID=3029062 RepID=A0AAU8AMM8_9RHOB
MRDDQLFFWGGLLAAALGSLALMTDHLVFNADLLEPSSTPHSGFFAAGVFIILSGGAALVAAFARD